MDTGSPSEVATAPTDKTPQVPAATASTRPWRQEVKHSVWFLVAIRSISERRACAGEQTNSAKSVIAAAEGRTLATVEEQHGKQGEQEQPAAGEEGAVAREQQEGEEEEQLGAGGEVEADWCGVSGEAASDPEISAALATHQTLGLAQPFDGSGRWL